MAARNTAVRNITAKIAGTGKNTGCSQRSIAPAIPNFDRLIHEHIRLGIVSALAVNPTLTFNDLKRLLNTTDGNLSVHARKLEEARYIACSKTFEGRMPKTEYALSTAGRHAFEKYLNHMEALVEAMRDIDRETDKDAGTKEGTNGKVRTTPSES